MMGSCTAMLLESSQELATQAHSTALSAASTFRVGTQDGILAEAYLQDDAKLYEATDDRNVPWDEWIDCCAGLDRANSADCMQTNKRRVNQYVTYTVAQKHSAFTVRAGTPGWMNTCCSMLHMRTTRVHAVAKRKSAELAAMRG